MSRRHDQQALLAIIWECALAAGLGGLAVDRAGFRSVVAEHSGYGEVALNLLLRAGRDAGYWTIPDARGTFLGSRPSVVRIHTPEERQAFRKGVPVYPLW